MGPDQIKLRLSVAVLAAGYGARSQQSITHFADVSSSLAQGGPRGVFASLILINVSPPLESDNESQWTRKTNATVAYNQIRDLQYDIAIT
jgi:hypothetical protein